MAKKKEKCKQNRKGIWQKINNELQEMLAYIT